MSKLSQIIVGAKVPQTSSLESAENYARIVFISANYRVIVCRNEMQWIIQHKRGKSGAGARWRPLSYCVTQKALVRDWCRHTGLSSPALGLLPERIGGLNG